MWFWISGYQNPTFLSEKAKEVWQVPQSLLYALRIGNINDLVFRYRIMRACNFSEKLSPLIKNNYQLFIVERMVLLGAKVLVKTWKENAGDISLSDEKKKKIQRWEPVIVTWAALINLQWNYSDSHITGMISVYPEWSSEDCFHALAGGPLAITIMSFGSVLNWNMWTPLNWAPKFEWYMAGLVVKNDTKKACVMMSLDYVLNIDTSLGLFVKTIGRAYVIT